jgi:hypothetical protein
MADEKKTQGAAPEQEGEGKPGAGEKAIAAACEAYGIDRASVFASRYDAATGEATVLTAGGTRVRWKKGAVAQPLGSIAVTGINPAPKRKPITGGGKK